MTLSNVSVVASMTPLEQPVTLDLSGVDVWMDAEGMARFYSNPQHMARLSDIFTGKPMTSTWKRPDGEWVEW